MKLDKVSVNVEKARLHLPAEGATILFLILKTLCLKNEANLLHFSAEWSSVCIGLKGLTSLSTVLNRNLELFGFSAIILEKY